jgi:insecticidal toxin complex protein TccC
MAGGAVIGFVTSTVVSKTTAYIGKETGLNTSVSLESGRLNPDKLIKKVYSQTSDQLIPDLISSYDPRTAGGRKKLAKEAVTVALGKVPLAGPGLKAIPGTLDILSEVSAAASALSAEQVNALDTDIVAMVGALEKGKINLAQMARKFDREEVLKKINVKTDKRIRSLNDLRTVLHSRSSKFTAV